MLLENKNCIIYGAGGGIGGGVARTFAREGANLFLTGRTRDSLEAVAEEVRGAGGSAEVAVLDASTAKRSRSTPAASPRRRGASTSPSTWSRGATCRGSRSSR